MADSTPIHEVRNIGPKTAKWLVAIGVLTFEDLERFGVIETYRQLIKCYPHKVTLNALWSLQGALLDIPWNEISPEMKEKLKAELEVIQTKPISEKFICPCCGFRTLDELPPGTYNICSICWWEDDPVQYRDPDYKIGANGVSLNQARENFNEFGASERRGLKFVRLPTQEEIIEKYPR